MIIVKLQWWLWNQMFQYAFAKALSLRNNVDFALNIFDYKTYFRSLELDIFSIENKYASSKEIPFYEKLISKNKYINHLFRRCKNICKKIDINYHKESCLMFDEKLLAIKSWYIEGQFQTEKYFIDFENIIRKDFSFQYHPSIQNQDIIDIISKHNSVSIHVRRGDYLLGNNLSYHWICDMNYYKDAMSFITSHVKSPVFFFFSDDMNWVKKNFRESENNYYIDRNTWKNSYEDMRLMSLCKHNIVANSSFSWWWAWLNSNKDKIVIAPKKWFKKEDMDIVPDWRVKI